MHGQVLDARGRYALEASSATQGVARGLRDLRCVDAVVMPARATLGVNLEPPLPGCLPTEEDDAYCDDCKGEREFTAGRALCNYTDDLAHIILKIKYGNKREYIEGFAKLLALRYKKFLDIANIDCIMPVPLHKSRQRQRGFNQSEILARCLSKYLGIPAYTKCLYRIKKTKDQKGLSRAERLHNLDNAFVVKEFPKKVKNILIVDDVYTTGTTIEKCAKILKDAGANEIYFLTICTGGIN